MNRRMYMSKILISGCGISFQGERPTWVKMLKLLGVDLVDVSGPAISNYLILNQLLEEVQQNTYTHVICQLTSAGKLDIELNSDNRSLMEQDTIRNFEYKGYWPSSTSTDHGVKELYYKYLYSPSLEKQDVKFKLQLLENLCAQKNIKLYIIQGYDIGISEYNIYGEYVKDAAYKHHDKSDHNAVPCRQFQVKIAKKINSEFLKMDLQLDKFDE